MRIYTGYYGNMKAYRGMQCVGISLGVPRWLKDEVPNCRALNPAPWMLRLERAPYTEVYNKLLSERNPQDILAFLTNASNGKDVVLLCYEKPNEFCHRQLVAEWLTAETGNEVIEFTVAAAEPEKHEPEQMELF